MAGNAVYIWPPDFTPLTHSAGTPITAIDINDNASLTSDAYDTSGTASIEITTTWVEGGDGAIDGDVTIYILRQIGATTYEAVADTPYSIAFSPVASATSTASLVIMASQMGAYKIHVLNESGQDGACTLQERRSSMQGAS